MTRELISAAENSALITYIITSDQSTILTNSAHSSTIKHVRQQSIVREIPPKDHNLRDVDDE